MAINIDGTKPDRIYKYRRNYGSSFNFVTPFDKFWL